MLTFFDGRPTRREFLRVGGLTLGGLTLPRLWELQAQANTDGRPVTDKSVVFLFLQGGPSQFETFDPKMSAPSNVRSATGEIATSLPGMTYGSTFERLAKLAHKTTIVRSFRTGDAQPQHQARGVQRHARRQSRFALRAHRRHEPPDAAACR